MSTPGQVREWGVADRDPLPHAVGSLGPVPQVSTVEFAHQADRPSTEYRNAAADPRASQCGLPETPHAKAARASPSRTRAEAATPPAENPARQSRAGRSAKLLPLHPSRQYLRQASHELQSSLEGALRYACAQLPFSVHSCLPVRRIPAVPAGPGCPRHASPGAPDAAHR